MIFKKGELFCGPGGLALGAKNATITNDKYKIIHEWANDIDAAACETFRHNICSNQPESVYNIPIQQLDIKSLPKIDALTFGFPCNDYSIVGKQKGIEGEYGPLYKYGVKTLDYHQPKWFLAENVGGLQSANDGKIFFKILNELSNAGNTGYKITAHFYKFEEYGVPQSRHRILIVGIRNDLNLTFKVPRPTHLNNFKSCSEAIEVPPIKKNAYNNEFTKHTKKVIEMLNHIPAGKNAWYDKIPEHLKLNVKGAKLSNIYKRLDPNLPSYTITGSGGGGTHVYHWSEPRALTNRERARLQTFDDDYFFCGGKEKVREQIGMAVPPYGVQIVFEAILKTFAGISYDFIEPKWNISNYNNLKKVM